MKKTWVKTEIITHTEQLIGIQPTPEMEDCIEFFFSELDGSSNSGILYINKEELPVIIKKMQEMMNYLNKEL